ncbi:ribonuclease HI [Thermonema lapsum]|uniref:Ribonuclease H n=1 Tax=Thermonema lapsum TaxID=28195 RepID=A0A846MPE8_9BACT|nr:ribonuclease HI [Thermonema lapsum]
MSSQEIIEVYTDGASLGNPGPGGYGVIMRYKQHEKEFSKGFRLTTNNRMELLAVIEALKQIKGSGWQVVVYSDSQYVVNAIEKGWLKKWQQRGFKNTANADLWKQLLPLLQKHRVRFVWVKGHAGHAENERCDCLAVQAAQHGALHIDHAYEATIHEHNAKKPSKE